MVRFATGHRAGSEGGRSLLQLRGSAFGRSPRRSNRTITFEHSPHPISTPSRSSTPSHNGYGQLMPSSISSCARSRSPREAICRCTVSSQFTSSVLPGSPGSITGGVPSKCTLPVDSATRRRGSDTPRRVSKASGVDERRSHPASVTPTSHPVCSRPPRRSRDSYGFVDRGWVIRSDAKSTDCGHLTSGVPRGARW